MLNKSTPIARLKLLLRASTVLGIAGLVGLIAVVPRQAPGDLRMVIGTIFTLLFVLGAYVSIASLILIAVNKRGS